MEPSEEAFAAFYADERDRVLRSLLLITGDGDLATDAVAEAFSHAFERWNRVSEMTAPAGWVHRVALNIVRRRERRRALELRLLRRSVPTSTGPPVTPDPELWAAVAALPTRQREVVVLR